MMLQQLVLESCFLTSSKVSFVRAVVALGVADLDGEGLWVALRDGVGVALTDALAVALTDGLGVVFVTVPFFQISFVPDLAHTYLTLETVLVVPTLVHLVPAIVAACEGIEIADSNTAVRRTLEYALNFMD
jgi:hypothetical protein